MDEIEMEVGDWGPCDIKYEFIPGDKDWGEKDFFEYEVYYQGDEDGSRKGEEISRELTEQEHDQIVKELRNQVDRQY
jgi:hypothetical protein